jgi:hypothetical protein
MAKRRSRKKAGAKADATQPSCTFEELQSLGVLALCFGEHKIGDIEPKVFSTGSYGLGFNGPASIPLPDGGVAECQCSINIVVKNSKNADG